MVGNASGGSPKFQPKPVQIAWFAAAGCVAFAGFYQAIDMLFTTFAPVDVIQSVYLCLFGLIMLALDLPLPQVKFLVTVKGSVSKFCAFLTRYIGRGIMFLFLGSMTTATLWDRNVSAFLSIVLGLFVTVVGIVSIVMGAIVATKVNKLKKNITMDSIPQSMDRMQFKSYCKEKCKIAFTDEEMEHVFFALSTDSMKNSVSSQDIAAFTKDDFPTMV